MGEASTYLISVKDGDLWRVQIAWPNGAINYFGKRGCFVQYLGDRRLDALDATFTRPFREGTLMPPGCHRAILDDFGPAANFAALNSFSRSEIRSGIHRSFVDTFLPLGIYNFGTGFLHYRRADI